MTEKDDQYMHEINRLECERDYWKRQDAFHAEACAAHQSHIDELQKEVEHWKTVAGLAAWQACGEGGDDETTKGTKDE